MGSRGAMRMTAVTLRSSAFRNSEMRNLATVESSPLKWETMSGPKPNVLKAVGAIDIQAKQATCNWSAHVVLASTVFGYCNHSSQLFTGYRLGRIAATSQENPISFLGNGAWQFWLIGILAWLAILRREVKPCPVLGSKDRRQSQS